MVWTSSGIVRSGYSNGIENMKAYRPHRIQGCTADGPGAPVDRARRPAKRDGLTTMVCASGRSGAISDLRVGVGMPSEDERQRDRRVHRTKDRDLEALRWKPALQDGDPAERAAAVVAHERLPRHVGERCWYGRRPGRAAEKDDGALDSEAGMGRHVLDKAGARQRWTVDEREPRGAGEKERFFNARLIPVPAPADRPSCSRRQRRPNRAGGAAADVEHDAAAEANRAPLPRRADHG